MCINYVTVLSSVLFLTVLVISVIAFCPVAHRNMYFISISCYSSFLKIQVLCHFYVLDKFPPPHVCFGVILFLQCCNVGMVSFCVQGRSAVLFIVSFSSSCSLECDSAGVIVLSPLLATTFVLLSI